MPRSAENSVFLRCFVFSVQCLAEQNIALHIDTGGKKEYNQSNYEFDSYI
ncbi:hypothetical protein Closa_0093 [[Clostridium] saccharolyticum WM1]|uniref:Uncharacterized protein n=1 Tax=Lacrimispora saccharolytica (strain ATCC 35040 / DSM 2544 / NRCC 2533 / WM1) TaxID=610130 RepID=D9R0T7_LACSW|nr:hypothetical protein Closa_0093 [[Clostridium] saccharolyticum WM1]